MVNGFELELGRFRSDVKKNNPYCEDGEALAQVAQRNVQGQVGWGLGILLVEGIPAHGMGLELDDLYGPF